MAQYSIRDLEKLSGIKAHTIRIWEKRYGLLNPHRTNTNIRYYDDEHLKYLLNVSLLVEHGYKISHVSKWTKDELNGTINSLFDEDGIHPESVENEINAMVVAMMEMNEEKFNIIFSSSVLKRELMGTITQLVYPLLTKIGIMWGINEINPAQEHFISNLVRQKLIVAIDNLPLNKDQKEKYVLFLPEGELHEIGLLVSQYIIRSKGKQSIYLGANVPFEDLKKVVEISAPKYLLTFLTTSQAPNAVQDFLSKLSTEFSHKTILSGGASYLFNDCTIPQNVQVMNNIEFLISFVNER